MSLFDKIKNSIKSSSNENNFKYLSKLIQKEKEIYLDRDIILDDEEIEDAEMTVKKGKMVLFVRGGYLPFMPKTHQRTPGMRRRISYSSGERVKTATVRIR